MAGSVAISIASPPIASGATGFADPVPYEALSPLDVAAADLNGDGDADMVVGGGGVVTVRLGNGDGTFGAASEVELEGTEPVFIDVGDVNGDGDLDVAVADREADGLFLLLGDGDGDLGMPTQVAAVDSPGDVAIGDFGGGAAMDVAITDRSDRLVKIIVQEAGGSFLTGAQLDSSGSDPAKLEAADVDGDGDTDLVVLNISSDDLSVFLHSGAGFDDAVGYDVGYQATDLVVADLDSAPGLDIAVSEWYDSTVSTLSGSGTGTFAPPVAHDTSLGPTAISAADLDADGDRDLITPSGSSGGVGILLASPDGSYQRLFASSRLVLDTSFGLATAQLDDDGELDLLVPELETNSVGVMLGDVLQLEPSWLSFGEIAAGLDEVDYVRVRNSGSAPVTPGPITLESGAPRFAIGTNGCEGKTLQPMEFCELAVSFFAPAGVTETFQGTIRVAGDAETGPRLGRVSGSSLYLGSLAADPKQLSFPTVPRGGVSDARPVTVQNVGDTSVWMGSAMVTGGAFAVAGNGCAEQVLGPGDTCVVEIVFQPPVANPDPIRSGLSGFLSVTSTDPPSAAVVALSGTVPTSPRFPRPFPRRLRSSVDPVDRALNRLAVAARKLLRGGRRGVLRLPWFANDVGGTLKLGIRGRGVLIARAGVQIPAGQSRRLSFRLTRKGRKVLRRHRPTQVTVTMGFRSVTGRTFRRASVLNVKAPRTH